MSTLPFHTDAPCHSAMAAPDPPSRLTRRAYTLAHASSLVYCSFSRSPTLLPTTSSNCAARASCCRPHYLAATCCCLLRSLTPSVNDSDRRSLAARVQFCSKDLGLRPPECLCTAWLAWAHGGRGLAEQEPGPSILKFQWCDNEFLIDIGSLCRAPPSPALVSHFQVLGSRGFWSTGVA